MLPPPAPPPGALHAQELALPPGTRVLVPHVLPVRSAVH
jgi:hypothetical protein